MGLSSPVSTLPFLSSSEEFKTYHYIWWEDWHKHCPFLCAAGVWSFAGQMMPSAEHFFSSGNLYMFM